MLRGHARILIQSFQPGRVMPARARLQFFAGHKVVDIIVGKQGGHLVGRHHAGIAAEKVEMEAANPVFQILQRLIDFPQGEPVFLLGCTVEAHAGFRTRAVIPQDDSGSLGRIVFNSVFQKLQEALLAAHGRPAPIRNGLKGSVPDFDQVAGVPFDFLKIPGFRPACQNDNIHVLAIFRDAHFVDILAGIALQIRPAHIDKQRRICFGHSAGTQEQESKGKNNGHDFFHLISPNSAALFRASARVETPSFW